MITVGTIQLTVEQWAVVRESRLTGPAVLEVTVVEEADLVVVVGEWRELWGVAAVLAFLTK